MYQEIKKLADEAVALQNKLRMEEVLRQISVICQQLTDAELLRSEPTGFRPAFVNLKAPAPDDSHVVFGVKSDGEQLVTYGTAKTFDSEAEMIADIQGAPSPVFPLSAKAKKGAKK